MKISVTYEDIQAGIPTSGSSCPIALAIERAGFCRGHRVRVYSSKIVCFSESDNVSGRFPLPAVAQSFVSDFDEGMAVQPFEFEVG